MRVPVPTSAAASFGPLWQEVQEDMMRRLDEITIDDLCRQAQNAGLAREAETTIDFCI